MERLLAPKVSIVVERGETFLKLQRSRMLLLCGADDLEALRNRTWSDDCRKCLHRALVAWTWYMVWHGMAWHSDVCMRSIPNCVLCCCTSFRGVASRARARDGGGQSGTALPSIQDSDLVRESLAQLRPHYRDCVAIVTARH